MEILLVRHGEALADWAQHADPGLSERGRAQADLLARELQSRLDPGWGLYSSPLARARETAAPLAALLQQPVITEPAFREIPSPVPLAERKRWLRQFMTERWDSQSAALHNWRAGILERLDALPGPSVIFTHFLVINSIISALQSREETLCFWPDHTSVTELKLVDGQLQVSKLGRAMATPVN